MIMSKVFIASSNQTKEDAKRFQLELNNQGESKIDVVGWWEPNKVFQNGDSALESLLQISREFDYAVVFLSPDYHREKKTDGSRSGENNQRKTPSDNCIFELGIFISSLGPKRCFVLCSVNSNDLVESLSDFRGVNYFKISEADSQNDYRSQAMTICKSISEHGCRVDYEPIPLITIDDLKELEIKKKTGNKGNLLRAC